jgi:hypothetical protein
MDPAAALAAGPVFHFAHMGHPIPHISPIFHVC